MKEDFIFSYTPILIKQLGYSAYHIRHREFVLVESGNISINAYNEIYFIIDDPIIRIESDYGIYNPVSPFIKENTYIHRGEIIISNPEAVIKRVKMIQVIIVN